ncbi:TPA: hypothetical protein N0F65_002931 [Lagenidium giganteum]|uniref:Reverse transcriptase Ty1/copia-type domain-containing protein n=1 Tax=Lagenidium giganteum TaxID=4803 RepID=A0AAV2Z7F9_9STRA|nr:TPA: hypothetical protein N0F65_002931 [Lagenidium giganteum]
MASVNVARALPLLIDFVPHCAARLSKGVASGPQVLTKTDCSAKNPILSAVERLHQAEALVALENVADKVYMDGVAQHAVIPEPTTTYEEAMRSPDAENWRAAMADEISSIRRHKTWEECELPPGKRALRTKWIFKVKRNSDGTMQRFKARLVVVGCMQKVGIDYHEVFAPVVRMESLRIVLAIVTIEDLECGQVDFDTAFVNGDCEDEVYVHQPDGIHRGEKHSVLRL